MSAITVSSRVSRDEVAKVVASRLGARYPVTPSGDPDSFRVGKGLLRARVEVLTGDQITTVKVVPFGYTLFGAINRAGIAHKVEAALRQSELKAS